MIISRLVLHNMVDDTYYSYHLKNIDFDMYILLRVLFSNYKNMTGENKIKVVPSDLAMELNCSIQVVLSSLKKIDMATDMKYTPVNENCVYIYQKKKPYNNVWYEGNISFKLPTENCRIYANRCNVVSRVFLILLNEIHPLKHDNSIKIIYANLARKCSSKIETIKMALKNLENLGLISIQNKEIQLINCFLEEE